MVLEGSIDDFEMTRRTNVRGRWQEIQKLSEVSQVKRLGKLADHRIQLKKSPFDSFFVRSGERRFEG